MDYNLFDLFVCLHCGRTIKEPSNRVSQPNLHCWCRGFCVSKMVPVVIGSRLVNHSEVTKG